MSIEFIDRVSEQFEYRCSWYQRPFSYMRPISNITCAYYKQSLT